MTDITHGTDAARWLEAFGKVPSTGGASVQIGCHIEEFCEMLRLLKTESDGFARLFERCAIDLEWVAKKMKSGELLVYVEPAKRTDMLDALCDQTWTADGVAYMLGMDKPVADRRVSNANWAKLGPDGKPVILPGGKIGKPAGWTPPNLSDCV